MGIPTCFPDPSEEMKSQGECFELCDRFLEGKKFTDLSVTTSSLKNPPEKEAALHFHLATCRCHAGGHSSGIYSACSEPICSTQWSRLHISHSLRLVFQGCSEDGRGCGSGEPNYVGFQRIQRSRFQCHTPVHCSRLDSRLVEKVAHFFLKPWLLRPVAILSPFFFTCCH